MLTCSDLCLLLKLQWEQFSAEAAGAAWVSGAFGPAQGALSPGPFCPPEPLCIANGASDVWNVIFWIIFNYLALCLAQDQLFYSGYGQLLILKIFPQRANRPPSAQRDGRKGHERRNVRLFTLPSWSLGFWFLVLQFLSWSKEALNGLGNRGSWSACCSSVQVLPVVASYWGGLS